MIKLIIGNKGSGKTKTLIDMVNNAAKTSSGNVVCIEKGAQMTYNIDRAARLINIDEYGITGFDALYGFVNGVLAGNYDITDLFVDAAFKIGGRDPEAFANMILKLEKVISENVTLVFTVSCDKSELPETVTKYSI